LRHDHHPALGLLDHRQRHQAASLDRHTWRVQGAMCTLTSPAIGTRTVQTPGNIVLPKSKHNVSVACVKQCYSDGVGVLASETEIMTAGNVVFGGLIGLGVDAASGAMNRYEPGVDIAMSPIPNYGASRKGHGVPMASTPPPPPG